ncbi:Malate dehydrogenase, NAD-dependent [Candidatus Magnetoovum chiemensis]|nr:Malate dehydrogenase, NAD-dependent [Candidatus Magnetoovum chiemensis]
MEIDNKKSWRLKMKKRVSIIGAGNVGATLAQLLAFNNIADIILYDIIEGIPQGKALDIFEACPLWNSSSYVTGSNDINALEDSDIVVITAGLARKPGMSRDDLLIKNAEIIEKVSAEIKTLCPQSIVIVITNPMDAMAHVAWNTTGFPKNRVMGMGGTLDATRFCSFTALQLNISPADINSIVLGGHGDQMVPMPRFTTVKGVPITELLSEETIDSLIQRTRNGGAEIVNMLKTGSAYYAPASAAYLMVKAVILDEKAVHAACCYLEGQYEINGLFVGVPAVIGAMGIERIIELNLNETERKDFEHSVNAVKSLIKKLNIL